MKPLDLKVLTQHSKGFVLACDEVGRGPLAGDVVSACVLIDVSKFDLNYFSNFFNELEVDDSKKLSKKKRERVIKVLDIKWNFRKKANVVFSNNQMGMKIIVSRVSPKEIDKINILQASLKSMANCVNALGPCTLERHTDKPVHILIDGNQLLQDRINPSITQQTVIKGDSHSSLIGLASIVAKQFRDEIMKRYDKLFPQFQFRKNSGYPTAAHKQAIKDYGILDIHRKSFKGVKEFCQPITDIKKTNTKKV